MDARKHNNNDQVHLNAFITCVVLCMDGGAGPDKNSREDGVPVQQRVADEYDEGYPKHDDGPGHFVPSIGDARLLEADGRLEDESRAQPARVK